MTREDIIEKFQDLNEWRRRDERAVHKPILILYAIGKLRRKNDSEYRLTSYREIEKTLPDLLKEFGPWRKRYNPADPFWRLQKNGIWEVINANRIRAPKDNAYITDLREHEASGGFPKEIAEKLQSDFGLTFEIIGRLLASHFPFSYHEDILQAVGIELSFGIPSQPRDPNFRKNILEAYKYRCAICGFNVTLRDRPIALEAAHIKWRMAEGPDKAGNGIALCSLHHKLFDRGAFTLSDQLEVRVSEYVNKKSVGFEEWLKRYDGQEINFPPETTYYPHEDFTGWHLKEVFKGPHSGKT